MEGKKRTAVLVVHGMGSQRPLDTVRGVIDAVWLDQDNPTKDQKRFWLRPERSSADVDLSVFTTSELPSGDPEKGRRFDFHELYWAHLMSETRAVAVLLWLFELGRRGPFLHPRMIALWWGAAVFLTLLILSTVFLVVLGILGIQRLVIDPEAATSALDAKPVLYVPILMLIIATALVAAFCLLKGAIKFAAWSVFVGLLLAGVFAFFDKLFGPSHVSYLVTNFFPLTVALLTTRILMGNWGVAALAVSGGMSLGFMVLLMRLWPTEITQWPWSLASTWSVIAACLIIGVYLAANAAFLQPYLGDAARYFRDSPANVQGRRDIRREAVNTLEQLHLSGKYDRIIVVAHSLGTVVAYDMLRTYFGRICRELPADEADLRPLIEAIDTVDRPNTRTLRHNAREIVRGISQIVERRVAGKSEGETRKERGKAWLVTDFVTLGSPLAHAVYLLSRGKNEFEAENRFKLAIKERQYPICPPILGEDDRRLTYFHETSKKLRFHQGALFGITRWTNLYFPMAELIWGDAIGGEIASVFGGGVVDVPVSTFEPAADALFTHVTYWDITRPKKREAPHIKKLRRAVNLEDDEAILPPEAANPQG